MLLKYSILFLFISSLVLFYPSQLHQQEHFTPVLTAFYVTATGYSKGKGCYQCGSGRVFQMLDTFQGLPWPGTIAVSHDLQWLIGKKLRVFNWPYWARDVMAAQWSNRIDIYFPTVQQAKNWGVRKVYLEVLY